MRTELEPNDIERIANKVLEKLLPLMQMQQPEKFLTVDELSAMLSKSKEQIYQWVNKSHHGLSDFPFLKIGKSLRFSKSDIIEWMKNKGKNVRK